ncbi:MAG: C4-dicarboxylic acid transporter DauA [Planctomycetota bacterium]|nr:MAG: C4-dicarboxylic acid transporter DauA [Planctomycetota bacterium]
MVAPVGAAGLSIGSGLREALRGGYRAGDLRADLMAGLTAGIVALPLAMALAIASGVPPQHGIYTSIVAGAVIALLGGSRYNVSGPTAAFVVILAPISAQFGLGGLLVATLMAGVILMCMGFMRLGQLIQFIPHPVTTGFTAGIGVVIATLQVKDLLGLDVERMPEHYLERVGALARALPGAHWQDAALGALTLAVLLLWPRVSRRVPSPLIALAAGAVASAVLSRVLDGFRVETIASRFGGIPRQPPLPVLPWNLPGPDGQPIGLDLADLRQLFTAAFAIAILGAIESLLCAVVADGMAGSKHNPDGELIAQGVGNVLAPFFGGIAATGAIARTATSIRSGARSPLAALVHALLVLAAVLALAPLLGYLPMASLAALLLLVAWNMCELPNFLQILRVAPRSDVIVLLTCFTLTVVFDMVVSVSVGVVLAALLFMRDMAELSKARLVDQHPELPQRKLPEGVLIYEVAGPMFFGAAEKAVETLRTVAGKADAFILHFSRVPAMDITGLVALESALRVLHREGAFVILAGVQAQPRMLLARAGIKPQDGQLAICRSLEEALALIEVRAAARRAAAAPGGA